jgi:hypothetical protein
MDHVSSFCKSPARPFFSAASNAIHGWPVIGPEFLHSASVRVIALRLSLQHWEYANLVELNQEAKAYAQLDERGSWFYEAIGNSTGMQGRILGFGQAYLETSKDKDGNWLASETARSCQEGLALDCKLG